MRYFWRVFLWENGRHATEYTKYVNAPIFLEDKLDETLDSGEIILMGMPIESKMAFPPKTKFRLERYLSKDYSDEPKKWDLIVEHDDVEEYTGCPDLCTHRVHLIEASAVAQGMHVDNIALTYELQDVDLNYKTTKDDTTILGDNIKYQPGGYPTPKHTEEYMLSQNGPENDGKTFHFCNSYKYEWDDDTINGLRKLRLNYSAGESHEIQFDIPTLRCYGCYSGEWVKLFQMNTMVQVRRVKTLHGKEESNDVVLTIFSGPKTLPVTDDTVFLSNGSSAALYSCFEGKDESDSILQSDNRFWTSKEIKKSHATIVTANGDYPSSVTFFTEKLTETEMDLGYSYTYNITCCANPVNQSGMIQYFAAEVYLENDYAGRQHFNRTFTITSDDVCVASAVFVNASFYCTNLSQDAEGGPFLMKGVKYSCYDLLQKALLTVDTQIIDNSQIGIDSLADRYSIVLHPNWATRLKATTMQETIFEGKNLWEVLLQIGYYLHAIPYLEFAQDGTDRFVLAFRQLGDTKTKADTNVKITVFNSRNLSDYFTQYDSYVTNLFSPQNEVDEWLVPKTRDNTYLISNDVAEIHTSRPILEVIEFDITYNGKTENALSYIFEESVYQILTSDNPIRIKPAKGNALYYKLGSNVIEGLNYVPPQKNEGTYWYSLKEICRRLFKTDESLQFNELLFHIKYRTQDELRVTQVRPDLQNFMRNSTYEKYPHHEQYYGQQDKIVDSERFSANLFGQLIRVGNAVYQRQEYVSSGNEKESGDLVTIGNDTYYVTETENEYYPEAILQKVTYSKNFNQLSKIVTIPSEPRFYEVSERSKIRREVRLMDFLEISTNKPTKVSAPRYLNNATWKSLIKGLLFNKESVDLPNFAYTKFMADHKRTHKGSFGQYVAPEQLFPSDELDRTDVNNVLPKSASDHTECITSLLHFPLHDGIVFEWDMEDNFKAGDYVDDEISGEREMNNVDTAYYAQQAHRYVDVMGRADLFTFRLFYKKDWTRSQAQKLPRAVIVPTESSSTAYLPSPYAVGLDKDNREELSFNYQINLLHRPTTEDTEDFFTFPNLFGQKTSPLKMCFLSEPQSLFNENISLSSAVVLVDNVEYSLLDNSTLNAVEVQIATPANIDLGRVKSIVLYQEDDLGGRYAYIVKNVQKLPDSKKLQSWWLYPVFTD